MRIVSNCFDSGLEASFLLTSSKDLWVVFSPLFVFLSDLGRTTLVTLGIKVLFASATVRRKTINTPAPWSESLCRLLLLAYAASLGYNIDIRVRYVI